MTKILINRMVCGVKRDMLAKRSSRGSVLRKTIFLAGMLVIFACAVIPMTVSAASEAEIEQAIEDGTTWLLSQQNGDGSWGTSYQVGNTGLALANLGSRNHTAYSTEISDGLNYLFAHAHIVDISSEPSADTNSNGNGVAIYTSGFSMYEIGIAVIALAECGGATPDAVVDVPGSAVNGWTYKAVLQDALDYLAFAQGNSGNGRGSWYYWANSATGDNSIAGYVVIGLAYADASDCDITIPDFVYDDLGDYWIDYIQNDPGTSDDGGLANPDGGSGYCQPDSWVNIYKTGNLLFQMALAGDEKTTPRVQNATWKGSIHRLPKRVNT